MPRSASSSGRLRGVAVDHVDARVADELPFEVTRESGIQFEEEQLRVATHPALPVSRECTPSPGPYSAIARGWLKSILLATRSTSALELGMMEAILKRPLQKPLKKQHAHKVANTEPRRRHCPATISQVHDRLRRKISFAAWRENVLAPELPPRHRRLPGESRYRHVKITGLTHFLKLIMLVPAISIATGA